MNKEKQIEEMAKAMHDGCAIVRGTNQCRGENCLDCGAVTLYEKGYRKASDVAREIIQDIIEPVWEAYKNSEDEMTTLLVAFICESMVTKLKKKYTEGEG